MITNFLTKIFGSKNERELKKIQPIVEITGKRLMIFFRKPLQQ